MTKYTDKMHEVFSAIVRAYPYKEVGFGFLGCPQFPMGVHRTGNSLTQVTPSNYDALTDEYLDYVSQSGMTFEQVMLVAIHKPYVLEFIDLMHELKAISTKVYSVELLDWWQMTEFPHNYGVQRLVRMFNRADTSLYQKPKRIPEDLYRGVNEGHPVKGLSWTADSHVADWYADRHGKAIGVYMATIPERAIYAYLEHEMEFVVNPYMIKNLEKVR